MPGSLFLPGRQLCVCVAGAQGTCLAGVCHLGSGEEAETRNNTYSAEMLVRIARSPTINIS